jgi:tRNA pseudouridine38-40 synthase
MPHWSLTLAYDGTAFHGWQVQPDLRTIQGTLGATLRHVTGETVLPQGSGRTDTGVHALGQVASFTLRAKIPPANLLRALNRALPPSIRVLRAEHVPPEFHARHSALRKTYEYRIFPRVPHPPSPMRAEPDRICPPILAPYVWDCPWHVDLTLANRAAGHILGTHDFTSFAATDPDLAARAAAEPDAPCPEPERWEESPAPSGKPATKTIHSSAFTDESGLIVYRVTGSGFLHHMVRNLVGTFVDAASARIEPDSVPTILAARSRAAAGQTAPARGLFLVNVEYPETRNDASLSSATSDHTASKAQHVAVGSR